MNDVQPDDWNEEENGKWTRRQVINPDYIVGKDLAEKQMRNPNYNGKWIRPQIHNPEYRPITRPHLLDGFVGAIGIDI